MAGQGRTQEFLREFEDKEFSEVAADPAEPAPDMTAQAAKPKQVPIAPPWGNSRPKSPIRADPRLRQESMVTSPEVQTSANQFGDWDPWRWLAGEGWQGSWQSSADGQGSWQSSADGQGSWQSPADQCQGSLQSPAADQGHVAPHAADQGRGSSSSSSAAATQQPTAADSNADVPEWVKELREEEQIARSMGLKWRERGPSGEDTPY